MSASASRPVINFYASIPKKYGTGMNEARNYPNFKDYHLLFPTRIAIVGSAGAGKTNTAMNIIVGTAYFTKIWLCVKTPEEPLYQFLIDTIKEIEKDLKRKGKLDPDRELVTVVTNVGELPSVDTFDNKDRNLVLFDDVITDAKAQLKEIEKYWVYGRKHGITTMFLSQSYFRIPKLIRDNTDVLILRGVLGKRDLNLILSEFTLDKTADELLEMYRKSNASNSISDFLLIDRSVGQDPEYRYRHNFEPLD